MKIILSTISILLLTTLSSNATGLFVGADLLQSSASHKARNLESSGPKNGNTVDADKTNYGLNAGIRLDALMFLTSIEAFYDNLDTSARNFVQTDDSIHNQDRIELKNRYGIKVNAGFAIIPRVTPFITFGMARTSYNNNISSNDSSVGKSDLTPLYGIGLLIDLPLGISAKASYDYQKINMEYAGGGAKINTNLGVAKLGLIYNF